MSGVGLRSVTPTKARTERNTARPTPPQPPKPQSVQDDGASNQAEASDDKALQREPASCAEAIRVGWCEVDHGGSGDCGWRALADNWAWRKDGNALSAKDSIQNGNWFRTASVRHIRSHADKYRAGIPWSRCF